MEIDVPSLLETIALLTESKLNIKFFDDGKTQLCDRWRIFLQITKALSLSSNSEAEFDTVWSLFVHCVLLFSVHFLRPNHKEMGKVVFETVSILFDFSLSAADFFAIRRDADNMRLVLRLISVLLVNCSQTADTVNEWCSYVQSNVTNETLRGLLCGLIIDNSHQPQSEDDKQRRENGWLMQLVRLSSKSAESNVPDESVCFNREIQGCAATIFVEKSGPLKIFKALCALIRPSAPAETNSDVCGSHCICVFEGLELACNCAWDLSSLRCCLTNLAGMVAFRAFVPSQDLNVVAVGSEKILSKILEFDGGGADHLHFRRNLEIIVLCNIFRERQEQHGFQLPAPILNLSLKLVYRLLDRVTADGRPYGDHLLDECSSLVIECKKLHPNVTFEHNVEWDCAAVYSPLQRLAVFLRTSGQSFLLFLLYVLSSNHRQLVTDANDERVAQIKPLNLSYHQPSRPEAGTQDLCSDAEVDGQQFDQIDELQLEIFKLMAEKLFKTPATDFHGPLLSPLMSSAVLNGFLSLLEATPKALSRVGVHSLAGMLVENGYLDLVARPLMVTIIDRWPMQIPLEVLLLVARLAFRHASTEDKEVEGSVAEMLWDSMLTNLENREPGNVENALAEYGQRVSHARVLAILFNTIAVKTRGRLLSKCKALFIRKVDSGHLDLGTLAEILGLLNYMLSHFSKAPHSLIWKIECLLKGESVSNNSIAAGGKWGLLNISDMCTVGTGRKRDSKENSSLYVLLEIVPPCRSLDLQTIPYLNQDEASLQKLNQAILQLAESVYSTVPERGDRVMSTSVVSVCWNMYILLDECNTARTIPSMWSAAGSNQFPSNLCLHELVDMRRWWCGVIAGVDLDLALACKGMERIANCNPCPLACVVLDALMAIIQKLVSGGDPDLEVGEELGGLQGLLLEDVELFMGAIEAALALFLSVASESRFLGKQESSELLSTRAAFVSSYEDTFAIDSPENSARRCLTNWDGGVIAGLIIAYGNRTTPEALQQAAQILGDRVVGFVAATCRGLDRMERTMDKTEMDSALCGAVRERLLALIADLMTDPRFPSLAVAAESCLKGACQNPEAHTLLLDLARLRRTDALLKTLRDESLSIDNAVRDQVPGQRLGQNSQQDLRDSVETVLDLVSDPRRSPAVTLFYLDHSPARDAMGDVKSPAIPEALPHHLPEALQSKGDIALLVHLLALSPDAVAVVAVLRILCAILVDRPTSASLARLKPFVRRRVAEDLVSNPSLLSTLLPRLLFFYGFPLPSNRSANWWAVGEAAGIRRGALRLFTLLLDSTDDAADALASALVEPLLSLLSQLLDYPRIVVRESFAAIKLVCFRQSQTSMSSVGRMFDVVLEALSLAANGEKTFEWTGNVVELVTGLVVSLQASWRPPTSDLSSATSAHVRASDTLSTVSTSSEISYTSRGESLVATSAVTYLSSTGHMEYDDLSGVGSAVECLSNTDATEPDVGDDQGSMDASTKADDASLNTGASDHQAVHDPVCTYAKTADTFSEQHWYHCWTCGLAFQEGVCAACAKVCHRGHDLTYSRFSRFFCDCGAGKLAGFHCRALVPRGSDGVGKDLQTGENGSAARLSGDKDSIVSDGRDSFGNKLKDVDMSGWLADCDRLPSQLTRQARETLLHKLKSAKVNLAVKRIYQQLMDALMARDGPFGAGLVALSSLKTTILSSSAKRRLVVRNSFPSLTSGAYGDGTGTTKPPAPRSGRTQTAAEPSEPPPGTTERLSLLSHAVGDLLLVCEGDQLILVDISGLKRRNFTGGTDQTQETIVLREKSYFPKPVSKLSLQWQPAFVVSNPVCPEFVALAGDQQCWIYKIGAGGEFVDARKLDVMKDPCLEGSADMSAAIKIMQVEWVPKSRSLLMIVTPFSVRVYDIFDVSDTSTLFFRLPLTNRIISACIALSVDNDADSAVKTSRDAGSCALVVMGADGALFLSPLSTQSVRRHWFRQNGCPDLAACDSKLVVSHIITLDDALKVPEDFIGMEGCAIHFSRKSRLLVSSFRRCSDGGLQSFVAILSPDLKSIEDWSVLELIVENGLGKQVASVDQLVDVGNSWGQFILLCNQGDSACLVQVQKDTVMVSCAPNLGRIVGMVATLWNRPGGQGVLAMVCDGGLHHLLLHEAGLRTHDATHFDDDGQRRMRPELPVDHFERGMCITSKVKMSAGLDSGAQATQVAAGWQGVGREDALKITIHNPNNDLFVIGVLVLVGETDIASIPGQLRLLDRVVETRPGVKRWYALPLSLEETLHLEQDLVLTACSATPPASDSVRGPPVIDQIEVYGMRKDKIGWAEKQRLMRGAWFDAADTNRSQRAMRKSTSFSGSGKRDWTKALHGVKSLRYTDVHGSPLDRAALTVANALPLLASRKVHLSLPSAAHSAATVPICFTDEEQDWVKFRDSFLAELPLHMLLQRPTVLRPSLKRMLKVLFSTRNAYCEAKDRVLLHAAAEFLRTALAHPRGVLQIVSQPLLHNVTSFMARVAHRRPNHWQQATQLDSDLLNNLWRVWVRLYWLEEYGRCGPWSSSAFHPSEELGRTAECFVDLVHSSLALALRSDGAQALRLSALNVFEQAVHYGHNRVRQMFGRRMGSLLLEGLNLSQARLVRMDPAVDRDEGIENEDGAIAGDEYPGWEGAAGENAHDHSDRTRVGQEYWQEFAVPDLSGNRLPAAGSNSEPEVGADGYVVYCCDRCGLQPVVGKRFHCRFCDDFDLCANCYEGMLGMAQESDLPVEGSTDIRVDLPVDSAMGEDSDAGGTGEVWSTERRVEAWQLYPPDVDPADEAVLMSLATGLSLLPAPPLPPPITSRASSARVGLASLASGYAARIADLVLHDLASSFTKCLSHLEVRCLTSLHLMLRLALAYPKVEGIQTSLPAALARKITAGLLHDLDNIECFGAVETRATKIAMHGYGMTVLIRLLSMKDDANGMHAEVLKAVNKAEERDIEAAEGRLLVYLSSVVPRLLSAAESPHSGNGHDWLGSTDIKSGEAVGIPDGWADDGEIHDSLAVVEGRVLLAPDPQLCWPGIRLTTHTPLDVSLCPSILALCAALRLASMVTSDALQRCGGASVEWMKAKLVWAELSCRVLHSPSPRVRYAHAAARKVLWSVCRSRSEYQCRLDEAAAQRQLARIRCVLDADSVKKRQILQAPPLSCSQVLDVTAALVKLSKIASVRLHNWESYCRSGQEVTGSLLELAVRVPEHATVCLTNTAPDHALRLLASAFSIPKADSQMKGNGAVEPSKTESKSERVIGGDGMPMIGENSDESGSESEWSVHEDEETETPVQYNEGHVGQQEVVKWVLSHRAFIGVIEMYGLQAEDLTLRRKACRLLEGLWRHGSDESRSMLLELLLPLIKSLPGYGREVCEFLETLVCIAGIADENCAGSLASCQNRLYDALALAVTDVVKTQTLILAQHPNGILYRTLQKIMTVEGYFLDSTPCLICSFQDSPMGLMKIDSLRAEMLFTHDSQIMRLHSAQLIHSVSLSLSDIRRTRLVKTVRIYYNNKPVTHVRELKGRMDLFSRMAKIELEPEQVQATVKLAVPLVASNLIMEFSDFHHYRGGNGGPGSVQDRVLCPRCNRPVTDRHGICRHCRENAYQCRMCRNINYEHLEGFLCNECGFCKHARFSFALMCKPTLAVDTVDSEESKAKAIQAMHAHTAAVHQSGLELQNCRRYLENLVLQQSCLPSDVEIALPWSVSPQRLEPPARGQTVPGREDMADRTRAPGATNVPQGPVGKANSSAQAEAGVSPNITKAVLVYGRDARRAFVSLARSTRLLSGLRVQLCWYLAESSGLGAGSFFEPACAGRQDSQPLSSIVGDKTSQAKISFSKCHCYGCALKLLESALIVAQKLAERQEGRAIMVQEGLVEELVGGTLRMGSGSGRREGLRLVCNLVKNESRLTRRMLELVTWQLEKGLQSGGRLDGEAVEEDLELLGQACAVMDSCWEAKYQALLAIFSKALSAGSSLATVAHSVLVPCLTILVRLVEPGDVAASDAPIRNKVHASPLVRWSGRNEEACVSYKQWAGGALSYKAWLRAQNGGDSADCDADNSCDGMLALGAFVRWLQVKRMKSCSQQSFDKKNDTQVQAGVTPIDVSVEVRGDDRGILSSQWISQLLLNPASSRVRSLTRSVMAAVVRSSPGVARSERRARELLWRLASLLPNAVQSAEHVQDFLTLFKSLLVEKSEKHVALEAPSANSQVLQEQWHERALFLASKGFLWQLVGLIGAQVSLLERMERGVSRRDPVRMPGMQVTQRTDVPDANVIKWLISLLVDDMLSDARISRRLKRSASAVSTIVECNVQLEALMVYQSKQTDESAAMLSSLLLVWAAESSEDKVHLCRPCVHALARRPAGRKLEALVKISKMVLWPEDREEGVELMLTKAASQQDFIRGNMSKRVYTCGELGQTMRDVKACICRELDLGALAEDDNGMELLVQGQIVALSLPIRLVYHRLWAAGRPPATAGPMRVVFRLQGLDGEATEPRVDTLLPLEEGQQGNAGSTAAAVQGAGARVLDACGGIEILINMLQEYAGCVLRMDSAPIGTVSGVSLESGSQDETDGQDVAVSCLLCNETTICCGEQGAHESLGLILSLLKRCLEPAIQSLASGSAFAPPSSAVIQHCKALGAVQALVACLVRVLGANNMLDNTLQGKTGVESTASTDSGAIVRVTPGSDARLQVSDTLLQLVHVLVVSPSSQPAPGSHEGGGLETSVVAELKAEELQRILSLAGNGQLGEGTQLQKREEALAAVLCGLTGGREESVEILVEWLLQNVESTLAQALQSGSRSVPLTSAASKERSTARIATSCLSILHTDTVSTTVRVRLLASGVVARVSNLLLACLGGGSVGGEPIAGEQGAHATADERCAELMRILAGLSRGCTAAQRVVVECGLLPRLQAMEGVCSDVLVGAAAQQLLEALCLGNSSISEQVEAARQTKAQEERDSARKQREKVVEEMRRQAEQAMESMGGWGEDLDEEEEELACVICHEGYRYKPSDILAAYVFCKPCSVRGGPDVPAVARSDRCLTMVSNLSVVHISCHQEATRAERVLSKASRSEWEAAMLRNHSTKCNNLLPFLGPSTPAHVYAEHVEGFWAGAAALGRCDGSRFRQVVYLVLTLLERLVTGASFATDSGGGSRVSNAKLLPGLIQLGFHALGDAGGPAWRQARAALLPFVAPPRIDLSLLADRDAYAATSGCANVGCVNSGGGGGGGGDDGGGARSSGREASVSPSTRQAVSPSTRQAVSPSTRQAVARSGSDLDSPAVRAAGGLDAVCDGGTGTPTRPEMSGGRGAAGIGGEEAAWFAATATLWFPDVCPGEGPTADVARILGAAERALEGLNSASAEGHAAPDSASSRDAARRQLMREGLTPVLVHLHSILHRKTDVPAPEEGVGESVGVALTSADSGVGCGADPGQSSGVACNEVVNEPAGGAQVQAGQVKARESVGEVMQWQLAVQRAQARLRGESSAVMAQLEVMVVELQGMPAPLPSSLP